MGAPPAGRVRLAPASNPDSYFECWLDGPCVPTGGGYGGWTVEDREGQEGVVEYSGPEPKGWVVPVLVDGWSGQESVQGDWDGILSLAEAQGERPPPQIKLVGSVPSALSRLIWLIQGVAHEEERLDDGKKLYRASAKLTLIKPNLGSLVSSPIKQAQAKSKAKTARTIHARKGDTLVSIAARELGDPARWREVSALNGSLQPDNLKAGQKVKLPK